MDYHFHITILLSYLTPSEPVCDHMDFRVFQLCDIAHRDSSSAATSTARSPLKSVMKWMIVVMARTSVTVTLGSASPGNSSQFPFSKDLQMFKSFNGRINLQFYCSVFLQLRFIYIRAKAIFSLIFVDSAVALM